MDLIARVKKDADKALKEIYLNEQDFCLKWLSKNTTLSNADNIEIFQSAVIILYDNIMTGKLTKLTSKVSTYLISICKNKSREFYRHHQKTNSTDEFPLLADHINEERERRTEKERLLNIISQKLDEMGDPCKALLTFFYYQKKSMEEICSILGYNNVNTTKNQKYKCIKRLQKLSLSIH